jgi:hypothetical protein
MADERNTASFLADDGTSTALFYHIFCIGYFTGCRFINDYLPVAAETGSLLCKKQEYPQVSRSYR